VYNPLCKPNCVKSAARCDRARNGLLACHDFTIVNHHSFAHEFIIHYPTHTSSRRPDSTIISAKPANEYPPKWQGEPEEIELSCCSSDEDEFGPVTYKDQYGNFPDDLPPVEATATSGPDPPVEEQPPSGQDPPVEEQPVESTAASAFEWPDINPEDKLIYKKVFHPFHQAECPVAVPSSPHPSQIMSAYYNPAFDTIETVADFDNNFSDALRGPCKISLDTWRYLFAAGVTSMASFGEFFPTHESADDFVKSIICSMHRRSYVSQSSQPQSARPRRPRTFQRPGFLSWRLLQ
jgi:hypothetical protein